MNVNKGIQNLRSPFTYRMQSFECACLLATPTSRMYSDKSPGTPLAGERAESEAGGASEGGSSLQQPTPLDSEIGELLQASEQKKGGKSVHSAVLKLLYRKGQ